MVKDKRRSGERARSNLADFFGCPGISFTETVEEELEWLGDDVTEECSELAFRIRLGIKRPGILAVIFL